MERKKDLPRKLTWSKNENLRGVGSRSVFHDLPDTSVNCVPRCLVELRPSSYSEWPGPGVHGVC